MGTVQNNNQKHSAFIKWAVFLLFLCITATFSTLASAQDPEAVKAVQLCNQDLSNIISTPDQDACKGSYIFSKIICKLQNRITLISCYMFNFFASKLGGILALIIVIYVSMFGAFVILGLTKVTAGEAVSRLLKIAIIWILATNLNIGFKLMHNFFNEIMKAGISIATTAPNLGDPSQGPQCLDNGNSPEGFGSFVNIECVFRSMFGVDSTSKEKREYLRQKQELQKLLEDCKQWRTSEQCVTQFGGNLKGDYIFFCSKIIGFTSEDARCTWLDRLTSTPCMTEEGLTEIDAHCEKMWNKCENATNPGCKAAVLNYERNFIYKETYPQALAVNAANPATISSLFIGALAFFVVPIIGPIIAMFLISIGLLMLYLFVRAIFGYLLVVVTIALLVSTAAVFLSFAFFESTKDYFEKWWMELAQQVIQPFILFAALIMFNHYVLGYVEYFQQLMDSGFKNTQGTNDASSANATLIFDRPTLDYENIVDKNAEHPYVRPVDYPYSKDYIEQHNPNIYAHCGNVAFGAEPQISQLPDETKIRCYNKHKDEETNYVIGVGILSRQLPQNNPVQSNGQKKYTMAGLSPDYLSCLRDAAKNCPLRALRAAQHEKFSSDIWSDIIAAVILSFAMISFIENIGTLVRITALKLSSLGPNIAPIGKADMRKGGARSRQYAYAGAIEGAGLATRKWMVRAGFKPYSSFWNVGKDTAKGVGKGFAYASRTSVSGAARDAGRKFVDKATPKPARGADMDFSDLKGLSPKEIIKSIHEDGIRGTGARIKSTIDTVVRDNIDKKELEKEQEGLIFKMVDGISNKSIDWASDSLGTENQHTGEFGEYLSSVKSRGPIIRREDIEATSTGVESGE